jgi:hypothetical protein
MKTKKEKKQYIILKRNGSSTAQVVTDLLINGKTRMLTVDFTKGDGEPRTINGMLIRHCGAMNYNPFEKGLIPVRENLYQRFRNGQCKTVATQLRMIDLKTVNRLAFNRKVVELVGSCELS